MEPFALAQLLRQADESTAERILECLSEHRKEIVIKMMKTAGSIDELAIDELAYEVLDNIKQMKQGQP
jgi:hypothetical protein